MVDSEYESALLIVGLTPFDFFIEIFKIAYLVPRGEYS